MFICSMMKWIICITLFLSAEVAFAQKDTTKNRELGIKLSTPKNATDGTTESMMMAMPHYDEALIMIEQGRMDEAIKELHEAMEISLELVEAQLLLGDLYYLKRDFGNALKYYHQGTDFKEDQDRETFQKIFYLGMRLAEYEIVWQNVKHYTRFYRAGEIDYILNSQVILKHYKNWYGRYGIEPIEMPQSGTSITRAGKNLLLNGSQGIAMAVKLKKNKVKKSWKVDARQAYDQMVAPKSGEAYFTVMKDSVWQLCTGSLKGKKLEGSPIEALRVQSSCRYPFYDESQGVLFFSMKVNGRWDLYYTAKKGEDSWTTPKPLEKVNSEGNDIAPYIHPETGAFYFSSDGRAGFGGYDVFECIDNETMNSITLPMNPKNLMYPLNSNLDEISIFFNKKEEGFVLKRDLWNRSHYFRFKPAPLRYWQGDRYEPVKDRW